MNKHRYHLGDLVRYRTYINVSYPDGSGMKSKQVIRQGVITGTSRNWWCIKGHVSINNRIISFKEISGVVKKNFLTKKQVRLSR